MQIRDRATCFLSTTHDLKFMGLGRKRDKDYKILKRKVCERMRKKREKRKKGKGNMRNLSEKIYRQKSFRYNEKGEERKKY